jgi:hypothetical protein
MFVHKGFWNCCQDRPAKAIQMDEGLYAACASCAATYGRQNGTALVRDLPTDWTAPTPIDHAVRLAEQALDTYRQFAHSDDNQYAGGWTDNYKNARLVLLATIITAYHDDIRAGLFDAETIYAMTVDNGESVAYCVDYVRKHPDTHPFRI